MNTNLRRWVGLVGLLFVALVIVSVAITPTAPSGTASAASVVSYYTKHKNGGSVNAYLIEAAVVVGLWFFWYLRNLLIDAGTDARLTTLGFAGAIIFGMGGGVGAGMKWAIGDAVNHVSPATLQGLSVLQDDLNVILMGIGSAAFLFATCIAVLKSGALAKWLGWLGIVLGVASLLAFLGPLPAGIWVLVTSIVLLTTKSSRASQSAVATT